MWVSPAFADSALSASASTVFSSAVDKRVMHEGLQHCHDTVLVSAKNPHHVLTG